MNTFWKELLLILLEALLIVLIVYDMFRKRNNPTDRLSVFLMAVLLLILLIHFVLISRRMLYNFGFWFHCRH